MLHKPDDHVVRLFCCLCASRRACRTWNSMGNLGTMSGAAVEYAVDRTGNNLPYSHKFVPLDERR